MEILKAENLVKYYGKGESLVKAVDHSSFSVASGEFVAIVGTSRIRKKYDLKSCRRTGHAG